VNETLPALLEHWAETQGDKVFLRHVRDGDRTYAQLHEGTLRWAGALRDLGVGRGDNVATLAASSLAYAECWFGIARLGACDTGVNIAYSGQMLTYVLRQAKVATLVTTADRLETLAPLAADVPALRTIILLDDPEELPATPFTVVRASQLLAAADPAVDLPPPRRHETACIVYTSGTTGPSKGVMVPWGMITASHGVWDDLTAADVFYSPYPLFHITGRLGVAHGGIVGGQTVMRDAFKTDQFWADIDRFGCTTTQMIPSMMNWLLDQPASDLDGRHSLRRTITAPVIPRVEEFKRRFNITVRTCFGMTETGIAFSTGRSLGSDLHSAGGPRPGYEARVVDEHDEEVPYGEMGEVVIRTDEPWMLNAGYFDLPDKTAAAWRNGWFHTGDGMRRNAEGEYWFVDRIKDSLRRRGENVSSFELEAFVNAHDDVSECAAIGVESEDGEQEIKVVVVPAPGCTVDPADLAAFVAERAPAFMVPRFIDVVDALPKTDATMRVKKDVLRRAGNSERTWDRNRAQGARRPVPTP
jgi:crotonobetaine/carnitine-CoA ligase